jgi:uncharacterized protein (DUF2237 family)
VCQLKAFARQLFNPLKHLGAAVAEVVNNDHLMSCVHEFNRGVRADVACATGDQNFGRHDVFCVFIKIEF